MFSVGIIGHWIPQTHDLMISLTPIFLLGMGIFIIHPSIVKRDLRFLMWVSITYIITFSIEAIGVATGAVFGEYTYGPTLGPMILEVPLVIGFNWVLVVVGAVIIANKISPNIYIASIIGGGISTLFDFFLEPVAIKLDYWNWSGGSIPIQNYVAWFLIATVFSYSFLKMRLKCRSDLAIHYLFVQALFFLILQIYLTSL